MKRVELEVKVEAIAEFYDVDAMDVVWHGNHARFLEMGRRALLTHIGYGYRAMKESGYIWPVVEMNIHYTRPISLGTRLEIATCVTEWDNRLKLAFTIRDADTGKRLARASATQVAVDMATGEMQWETPGVFRERIAPFLSPD